MTCLLGAPLTSCVVVMGEEVMVMGGRGLRPCQPHEGQLELQKMSLVYWRLQEYTKLSGSLLEYTELTSLVY